MNKKSVLNTRAIAEIAIFAAIAFILDFIQEKIWGITPLFPNGGSIGFAMIPIILIALRRGVICGGLCGLITSCLQMLGGIYSILGDQWAWYDPILQVLLDYTLTYFLVGLLAGICYHLLDQKKSFGYNLTIVLLAALIGGLGKFMSHYLAGIIYWRSFSIFGLEVSAELYSFLYNGLYCIPNIIIAMIFLGVLYAMSPKFFYLDYEVR